MSRVAVIGAGVVGASVAYRLAQAGVRVTILEAGDVGCGTSNASFAWTNANNKPPRSYHELNVAGMQAHTGLRDEFGDIPWWHGGGNLEWFLDEQRYAAQREKVERLRAWGYAAEWIAPRELQDLEPDIDLSAVGDFPAAYFPEEGWVDPVLYAHAMIAGAARAGAALRRGAKVRQIRRSGSRVTGVTCVDGEVIGADLIVNCAGLGVNDVTPDAGLQVPLKPTVGMLVFTPPVPARLNRVVHAPQCHLRPDGAGRLMLHREDADHAVNAATAPTPIPAAADDVVRSAARVLPGIGNAKPEAVRIGVRPIPADGYSVIGPMPGVTGYYVAVSHSAVTLAPFIGQAVAAEIAHGRNEPLLAPYRADRLRQPQERAGS
ncbi:MAG: NAD(P)/FAD-dependent oxidoreductase [Armatimonadota bacterium]